MSNGSDRGESACRLMALSSCIRDYTWSIHLFLCQWQAPQLGHAAPLCAGSGLGSKPTEPKKMDEGIVRSSWKHGACSDTPLVNSSLMSTLLVLAKPPTRSRLNLPPLFLIRNSLTDP